MRLLLIGAPGAGKGTQAQRLAERFGIAHISSGDLLRQHVRDQTALGRTIKSYVEAGDLVPDAVVMDMLRKPTVAATENGGYVLDGFPRTMPQALRAAQIGLELGITSDAVIYLTAPEEELVTRLLDRANRDGRPDDTLDVIRHRLAVYARETAPLVDYYRGRGILLELSTDRPEADVRADLRDGLEARGLVLAGGSQTVPDGTGASAGAKDR